MSYITLPRKFSTRENVGIQYALAYLDVKKRDPRGFVMLDDGMVACIALGPPRVTAILPASKVEWVAPEEEAPRPVARVHAIRALPAPAAEPRDEDL